MNKLLLSLGVVALLATPAAAGRLDVDQSVLQPSAASTAPAGVDASTTRSIRDTGNATGSIASDAGRSDLRRGAQGSVFGANGR